MHDAYDDIRSRIAEEPIWYDINGTPRFDQPHVPLHLMGKIRFKKENITMVQPIPIPPVPIMRVTNDPENDILVALVTSDQTPPMLRNIAADLLTARIRQALDAK